MSSATEVFNAEITATDHTSGVIEQVKDHLRSLGKEAEHVGHQTEGIHHPHMWLGLNEHIDLTKEKFHGMHLAVGEVGHSITELLPAFAALGAAGSVVSLFETTERAAEAYATLAHSAVSLGMTATALNNLRAVAKLTDTDVDMMERSVGRLNRTLGEAAAGKNKDAAALFAHLHLDPKSFHDGAEALPALADAFAHTASATMRARMAFALFGRAGMDMIPLLAQGGEKLRELQKDAGKLNVNFSPYAKGLEEYNEAQKKLTIATGGFADMLGGKLAPVLQPLTEEATNFILANREWITGDITEGVREFATWLEHIPFKEIAGDIKTAAQYGGEFVDRIGGARTVVDLLAGALALKGVMFLVGPIKEAGEFGIAVGKLVFKLGTELVGAWSKVGSAASAAGAEEMAALQVASGHTAAGAAALEAAEGDIVARVRGKAAADLATLDAHTNAKFRAAGIGSALGIGFAAYGAMEAGGFDEDKDFVRERPWLAHGMTRAQFEALPDHIATPVPLLGITDDPKNPGWIERHFDFRDPNRAAGDAGLDFSPSLSAPLHGAAAAPPPPGKVNVVVDFRNMPAGVSAQTTASGTVGDVRTNLGAAFADQYP